MSETSHRLPSAERVAAHLEDHAPRPSAPWLRYVPLGVVVFAVVLSLGFTTWWAALLPWVALAGVIVQSAQRRQRQADIGARALYAQELAMLRHHREALRMAWRLLPDLVHRHEEHARTTALLGHLLHVLGADDAATVAYEFLLSRLPDGHPAALSLRLQKAVVCFEADRLNDGDAELRRVRSSICAGDAGPIGAAYRAARLLQSVNTHHFAEAVDELPDPAKSFRPLGIDAGAAYGLLALARLRLGDRDTARLLWVDATRLIPENELIRRFSQLSALREIAA